MTYDVLARADRARRRRLRRIALVAGAVALLVTAAILAPRPGRPGSPHTHSPSPAAGAGTPVPATTSGGQPDAGTAAPLPADLSTATVAGVTVAESAQAGPHRAAGGLATGFSHDRAGAVLAAVNLLVRVTPQVGSAVFGPTLRTQVCGPNATAFADQIESQYQQLCAQAGVAPGGPVGSLAATFVGYQIRLYSDTTVLLAVLTEANQANGAPLYLATVVQLAWTGGDWTLVAPSGGVWDQSVTEVAVGDVGTFNPFTAGR
jgi:hypothetical protein